MRNFLKLFIIRRVLDIGIVFGRESKGFNNDELEILMRCDYPLF